MPYFALFSDYVMLIKRSHTNPPSATNVRNSYDPNANITHFVQNINTFAKKEEVSLFFFLFYFTGITITLGSTSVSFLLFADSIDALATPYFFATDQSVSPASG